MRSSKSWAWVLVTVCLLVAPAFPQQPISMPPPQTADVFGQRIRYYESGQGPVVILLHGLGANSERWAANIPPLSKEFHVYALDLIGFGHSDKLLIDYRIETFVDFVREFMRVVNVPKATFVGHSLGGWIAAQLTIEHPELVDKLVLVDAAGLVPVTVDYSYASLTATRSAIEAGFYNKQLVSDDLVRRVFQGHLQANDSFTIQRVLNNAPAEFLGEKPKSIHAPTLILWGRQDGVVPLPVGEKYHEAIARSQMVIIDECGHLPQAEKSSEFNKAVLNFLIAKP